MPTTIEQALICGDTITTNGVTFKIVKSSRFSVDVEVTSPDEVELNPDADGPDSADASDAYLAQHPDAEVAADAINPNAHGRTIGGRLPGGVRA